MSGALKISSYEYVVNSLGQKVKPERRMESSVANEDITISTNGNRQHSAKMEMKT